MLCVSPKFFAETESGKILHITSLVCNLLLDYFLGKKVITPLLKTRLYIESEKIIQDVFLLKNVFLCMAFSDFI